MYSSSIIYFEYSTHKYIFEYIVSGAEYASTDPVLWFILQLIFVILKSKGYLKMFSDWTNDKPEFIIAFDGFGKVLT